MTTGLKSETGRRSRWRTTQVPTIRSVLSSSSRPVVLVGLGLLGLQFLVILVVSVVDYQRLNLGSDFSVYSQAWTLIGRGHLDPVTSISQSGTYPASAAPSFLSSRFELLLWPLALLYPIFHSAVVLKVIQALAVLACNLVVFVWVLALIAKRRLVDPWATVVCALCVGLLLCNPFALGTATMDFHLEPLACCFVLLAAFDLWSDHKVRMWLWVVLALSCGDVGGVYLVGAGISGLIASRATRRSGLAFMGLGVTWLALIADLGDNLGSSPRTGYAYLAGRATLPSGLSGPVSVVGGVLSHPSLPISTLWERHGHIGTYLLSGGVLGILSPWGIGVSLVTLLSSGLLNSASWIMLPFENFAVLPFVIFGSSAIVLVAFGRRSRAELWRALGCLAVVAMLGGAIWNAVQLTPGVGTNLQRGIAQPSMSADEGAALRAVLAKTSSSAEVIASSTVVGGFSQRAHVYALFFPQAGSSATYPANEQTIVVVLDRRHPTGLVSRGAADLAFAQLVAQQHATLLEDGHGVLAATWQRPLGVQSFSMP
jgi:hypothetical protein